MFTKPDEIPFPAWLSPLTCMAANMIVAANVAPIDVVTRLACDERMRTVWAELRKNVRDDYRTTDRPVYQATLPPEAESWSALSDAMREQAGVENGFGRTARASQFQRAAGPMSLLDPFSVKHVPSPEMLHEMALATLFTSVLACFVQKPETVTLKELNIRIATEREIGRDGVAEAYESLKSDPVNRRFIVNRRRTESDIEGFVEALALEFVKLFGQELPNLIATITNVMFERNDMTRDRIRAILKTKTPAKSA